MSELWQDISTGFSLALVAYVATNIDNFLALIGLSARESSTRPIILGFFIAAVSILALSTLFVLLSYLIPPSALRYLGLVPITIGLRLLVTANSEPAMAGPTKLTSASIFAFLAVSSMDTVATFGPLLAESEPVVRVSMVTGFIVMASVMIWTVLHVSRAANQMLKNQKFIHLLAPVIMIGVGIYILLDTATDLQPG